MALMYMLPTDCHLKNKFTILKRHLTNSFNWKCTLKKGNVSTEKSSTETFSELIDVFGKIQTASFIRQHFKHTFQVQPSLQDARSQF